MSRKKVLLVDDSSVTLMMQQMILSKRTSYELATAMDGAEAVKKATTDTPDLILMDVCMPKMNGFEACQALKRQPETMNIPIILVTTRSEEEYVEAGFQSGCSDYITKPINSLELVSMVRSYIGD